jgi:hypothetical protein
VSTDGVLNIVLGGVNPAAVDNNPILNGLTLEAVPAQSQNTVLNGTVGQFRGGDLGEGLDFLGTFAYAINVGGNAVTVGDARFTAGSEIGMAFESTPGATITDAHEIVNWHTADYGATPNDNGLESVVQSIRFNGSPAPLNVDLNVVPNQSYKLQLLFAES